MAQSVEQILTQFREWLQALYGPRLRSLVVYGSAAAGYLPSRFSDINLLCVLDRVDAAALDAGEPALRWWIERGYPPVVVLSEDELRDAADVFAIEYLDIQQQHRVLAGEDFFAEVPRYPEQHRLQVEHDLRTRLIRLRAGYVTTLGKRKALRELMLKSSASFITLFRHALVVRGQPLVREKAEVVAAAARTFGFAPEPLLRILAARRGEEPLPSDLPGLRSLFADYLQAIQRVERALEES
jgi:hypothetical protein